MHVNINAKRVGCNKMCTCLNTHTHTRACLHGMYTLNYSRPLMIVVIMCGGKSHFHKVSFSPSLSLFSPLTPVSTLSPLPSPLSPPPSAPLFPFLSSRSSPCISLPLFVLHLPLALTLHLLSSLWSAHPSLLLLLLPQGYLPSYTASPHPSLSLHLFISMSKSHPFIFLQMNRLCLWKRTEEKRSRTQRNTASLSP